MLWVLIRIALLSTHNICFYGDLTKLSFNYHQIPTLSVPLRIINLISEPPHDKTNKVAVRPAKTQISLGIHPVWFWSEFLLALIRKVKAQGFFMQTAKTLIRLGGCWFCHEVAHFFSHFFRQTDVQLKYCKNTKHSNMPTPEKKKKNCYKQRIYWLEKIYLY